MADSLLRSIAVHDALHPAPTLREAAMMPRGGGVAGMAAMGNPNGGFLDRITGSPLGQIGMALLAGGGGQLGGAAQMLMQQSMYNRLAKAQQQALSSKKVEHIGNTIGMIDPQTGEFTPTYTAPQNPTEYDRLMAEGGITGDEAKTLAAQRARNEADPIVQIPLPGGQAYVGPKSGLQDALQRLQGSPATPGALAPPAAPSGAPAGLLGRVAQVESGNRDTNPDGSPVTSPAGARFAMQVMPATAHNPGFGITPAASDTPQEYDRVGRQYLSAMQQRYGGDLPKALAAYNAGPGRVDHAVSANGPNWLSALPAETQSYVGKLGGAPQGAPQGDVAAQAQAAIAAGADPQQVRARALQMGVQLP